MKIFNYIIGLILISGVVSCSDDDYTMIDPTLEGPTLTASSTEFTLDSEAANEEAVTFSWNSVDPGVNTPVSYNLQMDKAEGDFSDPKVLMVSKETSFTMTVKELNASAISLGIEPDETGMIDIRVVAELGSSNGEHFYSNTENLTVTAYTDQIDLSTTWGIVGDATINGWDGPDVPLYLTDEENVLVAYTTLTDGEIKFRENNEWDNDFGGTDGALVAGGDNIAVEAGEYKITIDLDELTYTLKPFSLGVVGDATANEWDGPDQKLTFDETSGKFRAIVELTEGEIKFRLNNDWGDDWGGSDGQLEAGGDNLTVEAGTYLITVDLDGLTYELELLENIWGIVGDATPNEWDGPDVELQIDYTSDYASGKGVWYANGVTLTDGEIKFRADNVWNIDYGSDNADGNLDQGGENIPVSSGTYDIVFDLDNMTYDLEPTS